MNSHLMKTYAPLPVSFERGEGAWLWDDQGKRYLDAISGLGVCALGHAHPELARVVAEEAATLIHPVNLFHIPWQ
jgi:acetylornithine aminotransferase